MLILRPKFWNAKCMGVAEYKKRNEKNIVLAENHKRRKDGLCNAAKKVEKGISEREYYQNVEHSKRIKTFEKVLYLVPMGSLLKFYFFYFQC